MNEGFLILIGYRGSYERLYGKRLGPYEVAPSAPHRSRRVPLSVAPSWSDSARAARSRRRRPDYAPVLPGGGERAGMLADDPEPRHNGVHVDAHPEAPAPSDPDRGLPPGDS